VRNREALRHGFGDERGRKNKSGSECYYLKYGILIHDVCHSLSTRASQPGKQTLRGKVDTQAGEE